MRPVGILPWLLACVLAVSLPARAEVDQPSTLTVRYEERVAAAVAAYGSADFQRARVLFLEAHALDPSARTLRAIGMCSYNLGDPIDALLQLEAALVDGRKPLAGELRTSSLDVLFRSQQKIGLFRLELTPAVTRVTLADGPPRLTTRGELLLLPGERKLRFEAPGHVAQQRTLHVHAGERSVLRVTLAHEPARHEVAAPPSRATTRARLRLWRNVGFGASALAFAAFGISGSLALVKQSELRNDCVAHACGPALHDEVDAYERTKLTSVVSLVVGAVLVSASLALWLWGRDA